MACHGEVGEQQGADKQPIGRRIGRREEGNHGHERTGLGEVGRQHNANKQPIGRCKGDHHDRTGLGEVGRQREADKQPTGRCEGDHYDRTPEQGGTVFVRRDWPEQGGTVLQAPPDATEAWSSRNLGKTCLG